MIVVCVCQSICLRVCLEASGRVLWDTLLLSCPFSLTLPRHSRVTVGVQLPPVISALTPPSSLHTVQLLHTVNHTSESGAAAFNQTPQNSPRGWVGCRPQQGPEESCVQPCPPMTQTERTGEEWRSSETNRNHLTRWIYYSTGGVTVSASACHMHSL